MALMVTVSRFAQLAKALSPNFFRLLGNVIDVNPVHLMKADSPIELTLANTTVVKLLQSENAKLSI